jgi:hypothetical protein
MTAKNRAYASYIIGTPLIIENQNSVNIIIGALGVVAAIVTFVAPLVWRYILK